jgi:ribosomal protein RSM22 (predicted rRNA methylase)
MMTVLTGFPWVVIPRRSHCHGRIWRPIHVTGRAADHDPRVIHDRLRRTGKSRCRLMARLAPQRRGNVSRRLA